MANKLLYLDEELTINPRHLSSVHCQKDVCKIYMQGFQTAMYTCLKDRDPKCYSNIRKFLFK